MPRLYRVDAVVFVGAALLSVSAAQAQIFVQSRGFVPFARPVFPRSTGGTLGLGVTRPSGSVLGPGVTRPSGATPGPGVPRAMGAVYGPGVTRSTGSTFGPGVTRPTGALPGPGVSRSTGGTFGPGVTRPNGAIPGPGVTRSTGATPGPGVLRAVGAIPGPNVGRPTGGEFDAGVERPTGASFGFTFRPLLGEPFHPGDRFPKSEAQRAGHERTDLSADGAFDREDLIVGAPVQLQPFRADLLIDAPLSDRLDLLPDVPVEGGRPDLRIDAPQADRDDLRVGAPERFQPFRADLSTEAPPLPSEDRADLLTDTPLEAGPPVPVIVPPVFPQGPIVGGTFIGGMTGTLDSRRLDEKKRLATWRLFDDPDYQAARFATSGPLPRNGPSTDRSWIVSGDAGMVPSWSVLRSPAGFGPEWSVLSPR